MSAPPDRKPMFVLLGLALLVVALFVAGAVGAAGSPTVETRGSWFGSTRGGQLEPDDLVLASGAACSVSDATVSFAGACAFEVTKVQGGLPWSDAVRRTKLRVTSGVVVVAVRVEDRAMTTTLDPGEDVRLVFTRDGGPLTLACAMVGGCTAVLLEDSGP